MAQVFIQLVLLIIFTAFVLPLQISAEVVDKVVAVVNDDIITQSELDEETSELYQQLLSKNPEQSLLVAMDEAQDKALNSMIDRRLVQQRAKLLRVTVTKEEIDLAFEKTRQKLSINMAKFIDKLKQSGLTEESYRRKLEASILQSKLLSVDVRSKIVITEEMIVDHYDSNYTSKIDKGSYYILQMGFSWDNDLSDSQKISASKKKALNTAERIKKLAVNGQDFKSLAKKFSDLPSAADGGDLGVFTLDEMAPNMSTAISTLNPGEISDIIVMGSTYQFFKVISGDENEVVVSDTYEAVKDEIREELYEEKLEDAYLEWVKKLKENAYIQKL